MIRHMLFKHRFWLMLALMFVSQLLIVGAFFLSIRVELDASQQTLFDHLMARSAAPTGLIAVLLLMAQGLMLKALIDRYPGPMARMAEEVGLMTSNPAHRIVPHGAREVRVLADKLNALAASHQQLQESVQERIDAANRTLVEEKNRLAALMSELAQSVLVCNVDGRILLYNARARQLLEAGQGSDGSAVGLGRSVYGVLERAPIEDALEQIRSQLQRPLEGAPLTSFVTTLTKGQQVRVQMAPVLDSARALNGFVLTLEGITQSLLDTSLPSGEKETPRKPPEVVALRTGRPEFYDFDLFHQPGQTAALDELPLSKLIYTVFDTETTGLHPTAGDEIISIGAVRIVNGRLLAQESFDKLVQPGLPVRPESSAIHGITDVMLKGQPRIDTVLPQFHRFADDTVLVAHNAAFDMKFLQVKQEQTGVRFIQPVLDTMLLSQVLHPNQREHSLDAIARRFGVDVEGRHTALGDAWVAGEVFLKMIPLLAEKGILTLKQAREAEQQTAYARVKY